MASVLTTGSLLVCAHGGQARTVMPSLRVRVAGQPALVQVPLVVTGCANPPPPVSTGPCVIAQFATAANRVRATGLALLVDSGRAVCTPTGTPLTVAALQARVDAQ